MLIVPLAILALFLAGCPKRPGTITAKEPLGRGVAAPPAPGARALPGAQPVAPGTPSREAERAKRAAEEAEKARAGAARAPGVALLPGAPGTARAPGAPGGPGVTPPGPAPLPREFVATPELKDIHFDFDKYDIRPGDAKSLDKHSQWLRANPRSLVLIEGHADERGTNEYNLALGERRAQAAMDYLIARGVAASQLNVITYGEERPLCIEATEACWSQNRRAHFLVKRE